MKATVTWDKDLRFTGVADSNYVVKMDSKSGPETGAGPVELTAMALAGCTAMDVIAILLKKRQKVSKFHVQVHADRATHYPKVITRAELEYVVCGSDIAESSLVRAIELSITKYCPVHAMLVNAFPISLKYSIWEGASEQTGKLTIKGSLPPSPLGFGHKTSSR